MYLTSSLFVDYCSLYTEVCALLYCAASNITVYYATEDLVKIVGYEGSQHLIFSYLGNLNLGAFGYFDV